MNKSKIRNLTPLALFVLWPFAHFAATNIVKEMSWQRLIFITVGMLIFSLLFALLLHFFLRKIRLDRLAVVLGTGFGCFFLFHLAVATPLRSLDIYNTIPIWVIQGPTWVAGTLIVMAIVWVLSRREKFADLCSLFVATMIVVSSGQGAYTFAASFSSNDHRPVWPDSRSAKNFGEAIMRPNVFFILLDGHPRLDQSKKLLEYDFSSLVTYLQNKGFFVAKKSLSNYAMSIYSISSTLNMNYTLKEGEPAPTSSRRFRRYSHGYNAVVQQFRRYGYYYVHGSDMKFVHCGMAEDMCLKLPLTGKLITEMERELIRLTPFRLYQAKWSVERFTPDFVARKLDDIPQVPVFVWAHIFSPHDRYYAEDCSTDAEMNAENFDLKTTGYDFKERTIFALRCLHPQLISLMDAIIEKFEDPIIVLQSDHGTPFLTDWRTDGWPREEFDERFGVLNAMRLPSSCRHMLTDDMTLVNTFRIIFACLSGKEPDLLEDRFFDIGYYSTGSVKLLEWAE